MTGVEPETFIIYQLTEAVLRSKRGGHQKYHHHPNTSKPQSKEITIV